MGGSAENGTFTFAATHFSQYALVSAASYSGTAGGTGSKESNTFLEKAEAYYGENGTIEVGTVKADWLDMDGTVKAGQQVNLNLAWTLTPAATFNYSEFPQTLFDDYENTQIILTLPESCLRITTSWRLSSLTTAPPTIPVPSVTHMPSGTTAFGSSTRKTAARRRRKTRDCGRPRGNT